MKQKKRNVRPFGFLLRCPPKFLLKRSALGFSIITLRLSASPSSCTPKEAKVQFKFNSSMEPSKRVHVSYDNSSQPLSVNSDIWLNEQQATHNTKARLNSYDDWSRRFFLLSDQIREMECKSEYWQFQFHSILFCQKEEKVFNEAVIPRCIHV